MCEYNVLITFADVWLVWQRWFTYTLLTLSHTWFRDKQATYRNRHKVCDLYEF